MIEDVHILKVQREHQAYHVREPSDGSVRQPRPDSDKAESDLDGSADSSCAHYLIWNRTTTTFSRQRRNDYRANIATRKLSIEFQRAITPVAMPGHNMLPLRRSLSINRNYTCSYRS